MSIKLIEEQASPMKQGIVTILRPDNEGVINTKTPAASIRRTLSADMSSKKWLSENGFLFTSPIKKNISSQVLVDMNPIQDEVWRSISHKNDDNSNTKKPGVWGDLLNCDKKKDDNENNNNCSNYVHPLLKRTSRSLSEKSLEVCTESLGSETGSDVYSNSGFSSDGDEDFKESVIVVKECHEFKEVNYEFEDLHVVKYKKSPVRPFPPPLSSIAGGGTVPALHMHSRRENGRLVVEAVSVAPRNNFHARRSDGRLVLTLVNNKENKVVKIEKMLDIEVAEEKVFNDDVASAEKFVVEQNLRSLPCGLVMKKLMAFGNKNPNWSNKAVNVMAAAAKAEVAIELTVDEKRTIPHPLPPRVGRMIPSLPPTPPMVASFNVYEYFWRSKTTVSGGGFTTTQESTAHDGDKKPRNQDLVVMRGNKGDYFVGCKEQKRSPSFWEPYCIATS